MPKHLIKEKQLRDTVVTLTLKEEDKNMFNQLHEKIKYLYKVNHLTRSRPGSKFPLFQSSTKFRGLLKSILNNPNFPYFKRDAYFQPEAYFKPEEVDFAYFKQENEELDFAYFKYSQKGELYVS